MPDPFAHVSPGDDLSVSAVAWNAALAAGLAHRQPGRPDAPPARRVVNGRVEQLALNDTGADLDFGKPAAVTAAGGYDLTDTAQALAWLRNGLLTLGVPAGATDFVVVTAQPIPDGKIGWVAVLGLAACDVDVSGGELFGRPTAGSTGYLTGTDTGGPIRILDVPAGSGTVRRCAVLIGGGTWQKLPDYPLRFCPEVTADGCPTGRMWVTWADDAGNTSCEVTDCEPCEGEAPAGCDTAGLLATIAALEARVTALEGGP